MEQPWPPPGPWSLPRVEGEAEEESDLDLSPGSPRCPPLPGGDAQVRRGSRSAGEWGDAVAEPLEGRVSKTRSPAQFYAHFNLLFPRPDAIPPSL